MNNNKITYNFVGHDGLVLATRSYKTLPKRSQLAKVEDRLSMQYGAYVFAKLVVTLDFSNLIK
jgi:hypothetical protein